MLDIDWSRAAIVAAHPDDEVLWFASLVQKVGRIVLCYGAEANGALRAERRRVIERHPHPTVDFLDLRQPGLHRTSAWPDPTLDPMGMTPRQSSVARDKAIAEVVVRLRGSLKDMTTVFTHNPWGEYGHEEHSLVYAAITSLRREMGFDVLVSPYVGGQVLHLCRQVVCGGINGEMRFTIEPTVTAQLEALYRECGAWTWFATWSWPARESFFRLGSEDRIRDRSLPFEIIDVPPPAPPR